ncbi:unnamed protein product [Allacma fusca]|uniref:Uncharacterized protein n=1 Tax=Allacma fusca TaxID=39272 RepID=A0A8J2KJB1_9HEXA|nr:unnamed protein product [Allacma fusca]
MGVFHISVTKIGDETCERMQVDVGVPNSSTSAPIELTEKLASFQVLEYKSYLLNVFKAPQILTKAEKLKHLHEREQTKVPDTKVNNDTPEALPTIQRAERSGDKILEMLHFAGECNEPKVSSRQDVNTTLTSCSGVTVAHPVSKGKEKEICPEANLMKSNGVPLRTVIINLEDWKSNQTFSFSVNTRTEAGHSDPSQVLLIPFEEGGLHGKDTIVTTGKDKPDESNPSTLASTAPSGTSERRVENVKKVYDPLKMQLLVGNSLIITIQGSRSKLYAHELNNNEDDRVVMSSTKALLEQRQFTDISENALTDDGIPLVPTKKEIVRELIRERLCSLGMDPIDCGAFLDTRDIEFISHRSLSVKLPLNTRADATTGGNIVTEPGTQLSISFEIQARYQTLLFHATNLNKIVNSAAVSVIESSIFYILPHLTLTAMGRRLNHLGPSLIDDWLEVVYTAAYQLKPSDPNQVSVLVEREMKQVTKAAELLLKSARKTLVKVRKLNETVEGKYRKANLPKLPEIKEPSNSCFPLQKTDVGYSSFLQKMGVSASSLYHNHMYISVGKYGLMLKRHLRDSWFQYDSLSYPERRIIFLGLIEHMLDTLKSVTTVIQRIQELQVDGYPANVHSHLKVVFQLAADLNNTFSLPGSMSATVLKQSRGIMQAFTRLVAVVTELYTMAKISYGKFNASYYDSDDAQRFKLKKIDQKATRVQLVIPFSFVALEGLASLKYRGENPTEDTTHKTRRGKTSDTGGVPTLDNKCLF